MKKPRLDRILGMIIAASSIGARGFGCGPCPETTEVIPILPPSPDGGVGGNAGEIDIDAECDRRCGPNAISCEAISISMDDGSVMTAIECTRPGECGAGRRPPGLEEPGEPMGWLAYTAFLEAASVDAFRALRRDLAALGAPRRLLRAASRAARDERRHARRVGALSRRRGARPPAPVVRPGAPPALEALAAHNAVEGCVRETFGALIARWQAESAGDREVAGAMARIAEDEARHAALAWEIDAWARRRLDPAARARVDLARAEAARALVADAARERSMELTLDLGLPDRRTAERLARGLVEALGC